jgi:hypothetical protein
VSGHVAGIGEMRNAYKILIGNLKARDYFGNLCVDVRLILRRILGKYGLRCGID